MAPRGKELGEGLGKEGGLVCVHAELAERRAGDKEYDLSVFIRKYLVRTRHAVC